MVSSPEEAPHERRGIMNILKIQSPAPRSFLRRMVMGLVLAAAVGSIAAPAMADDYHDRRAREAHERWEREHHRHYYVAPAPVYAPPPVVYAPPAPPAALNFVFPFNFH
jgi:hypothetical protein